MIRLWRSIRSRGVREDGSWAINQLPKSRQPILCGSFSRGMRNHKTTWHSISKRSVWLDPFRPILLVAAVATVCLNHSVDAQQPLAKFEPTDGKVSHGIGQPPMGIQEYITAMGDSSIHRLVHKVYYDIPGSRGPQFNALRQSLATHKSLG